MTSSGAEILERLGLPPAPTLGDVMALPQDVLDCINPRRILHRTRPRYGEKR